MKIENRILFKYKRLLAAVNMWKFEKMFEKLDDNQKLSYSIIKELISDKKTQLRIAPISGTFYLERQKEKGRIFVEIGHKEIRIVDDNYLYDVYLTDTAIIELRNHFEKRAEYKRMKMKESIMKNIKVSLQLIHDNLKKEQSKNNI